MHSLLTDAVKIQELVFHSNMINNFHSLPPLFPPLFNPLSGHSIRSLTNTRQFYLSGEKFCSSRLKISVW